MSDVLLFVKALLAIAPEMYTVVMTIIDNLGWPQADISQLKTDIKDYHDALNKMNSDIDKEIQDDPDLT